MKDGNDQVGGRHNANHKNQDMVGSRLRDTVVMATLREARYTDEQCWSIVKEVNGVRASGLTEEEGQECRTGEKVVTFFKDNLRVDVCVVPR